jgi:Dolichyl-phosphate-mannose-protein mannosyltransferase
LRLPFLAHQSLWFDEIYTRNIVGEPTLAAVWHQVKATESTPPLYYVVTWLLNGRSEAVLRLIPALSLTAAVPVGYLAFRRLLGERPALVPAAILAVSPELVSYSTDARSYGLYVLTALLTVWGFYAVLESGTRKRYALWAFASLLCVWTHYFGFFFVAAEVLALLVLRRQAWMATAAWTGLVGAFVVPLLPLVTAQADSRAGFIATRPLQRRLEQFIREFAMGPNVPRTWLEGAGVVIACAAVAYGVVYAIRRGEGWRALLGIAAFAVGAPLLLSLLGIEDRFDPRNVMPALPLAAALAAPGLLRMRAIPLAAYLGLALVTSLWVATNWGYENIDYRGALATARAIDPEAAIITPTLLYEPVATAYLGRAPATDPPLARQVWLLVEPARGYGQRALHPQPPPRGPAGFAAHRELRVHGFRLILYAAPRPQRVVEPGSFVFVPAA